MLDRCFVKGEWQGRTGENAKAVLQDFFKLLLDTRGMNAEFETSKDIISKTGTPPKEAFRAQQAIRDLLCIRHRRQPIDGDAARIAAYAYPGDDERQQACAKFLMEKGTQAISQKVMPAPPMERKRDDSAPSIG